ncbi:Lipase 2 [Streptomyces hirsutus]
MADGLFGDSVVPVHPYALGQRRMAEHTMSVLGLG